ncbi:glycosyltransferase family 4 protein [bacterium]|nr:glycosyltransferase family 4 protein [bacterium]
MKKVICYLATSAGDWGGASRVLFITLKKIDRGKYKPIVLFPSEGPILEQLDQLGICYKIWGKHEPNGLTLYIKNILKALYFFSKNNVDLLHINYESYWLPAEIIAAKLLRMSIITHFHIVPKNLSPYVKFSDLIIANSIFTAENSAPSRVPKKIVYNSVDLERYDQANDIRSELGISQEDIVISFIGQIREIKGIDIFINLANSIKNQRVKFLITGECRNPKKFRGSYTVERLHREIGQNKQIRYLGYRNDVQNIYRSSDIIIMPSRWKEPFGLINIEAGAARKPIISTRVGGIPEIIRHGENGYLVDKNDMSSLVKYTKRLINNRQLREQMGEKGRKIVEMRFTDRPIRELEKIYEELAVKTLFKR